MKFSKSLSYVLLGLMALVVSSYITLDVPWRGREIPVTAQSLVVLLIGYYIGALRGAMVIVIYVLLGAFNLPVFADGRSGLGVITGASGGYLLGFLLAAIYMGNQAGRLFGRILPSLIAMAGGTLWIVLPGVLWLSWLFGIETAFTSGFLAILPGAVIKIVIGAAIIVLSYRHIKPIS